MSENNRDLMPYNLYLLDGHILAQNIDGHIVDIGTFEKEDAGFHWQVDGNDTKGEFYESAEAVLEDISRQLSFLFLDGQFTSLPDLSEKYSSERLASAPAREVKLHELRDDDEATVR
ncbi:hypothetical protein [Duffyella gerundensis]|uniref:hypothetical protein n=1 Tax=Duffyella TaxID=3026546 RepID=UPI003F6E381A